MKFYITDVFGNKRYSGNQLATFFDYGALSSSEMQQIAQEINFSETTFITSSEKQNDGFNVRIFTPRSEIDFAGHPTLGTAYIINKHIQKADNGIIKLNYRCGQIPVSFNNEVLWMRQNQPEFGHELDKELLATTLGLLVDDIADSPIMEVTTGLPFTIVQLKSLDCLKRATVNLKAYNDFIKQTWAKGIMVFCFKGHEKGQDLSTRVFVNYQGIPEDPATGSATGCLAAYLLRYNILQSNKIKLTIAQGYEINRRSELYISAEQIGNTYILNVGGKVIEIAEGDWKVNK
mgnify:CR=1 FL=1